MISAACALRRRRLRRHGCKSLGTLFGCPQTRDDASSEDIKFKFVVFTCWHIALCLCSRHICVAGAPHVLRLRHELQTPRLIVDAIALSSAEAGGAADALIPAHAEMTDQSLPVQHAKSANDIEPAACAASSVQQLETLLQQRPEQDNP